MILRKQKKKKKKNENQKYKGKIKIEKKFYSVLHSIFIMIFIDFY